MGRRLGWLFLYVAHKMSKMSNQRPRFAIRARETASLSKDLGFWANVVGDAARPSPQVRRSPQEEEGEHLPL